jgi:flavin-dependent dehydrogenase
VYQRSDAYARGGRPLAELFARFLERHADRFRGARLVGKRRVWPLPLVAPMQRAGCPGLLVCGDAGHHVDPLTGEGIWQALATGRLAGEAAARALLGGALDDEDARAFRLACLRRVDAMAVARRGVQEGLQRVLDLRLDRLGLVRRALAWGYASGSLEVSKVVATGAPDA